MPTLECSTCGATYYTAATDQLLIFVLVMFGCEVCGVGGALHVIDAGVGYMATEPERRAA